MTDPMLKEVQLMRDEDQMVLTLNKYNKTAERPIAVSEYYDGICINFNECSHGHVDHYRSLKNVTILEPIK